MQNHENNHHSKIIWLLWARSLRCYGDGGTTGINSVRTAGKSPGQVEERVDRVSNAKEERRKGSCTRGSKLISLRGGKFACFNVLAVQRFQQVEVLAKDPRTVVLMLDSPEPSIVCKACQALHQHVEKGVLVVACWLEARTISLMIATGLPLQLNSTVLTWRNKGLYRN